MIGFFISIFIFAWKLTLGLLVFIIASAILLLLGCGLFWVIGAVFKPLEGLFTATVHLFGVKTWEERKQEYRRGKDPGWFDKINLWMEGNENNR